MSSATVSKATIHRFGIYIQALEGLAQESRMVSSDRLAAACGLQPGQIRKDLSWYGGIGRRGAGYEVRSLLAVLKHTLSVDRTWKVALVGPDPLGRALLLSSALARRGFAVAAVFSGSSEAPGESVGGLEVHPLRRAPELVPRLGIEIGVIATPAAQAQHAADVLVRSGVAGLLCYAPALIRAEQGVFVLHVDICQPFMAMAHALGLGEHRAPARLPKPRRRAVFPDQEVMAACRLLDQDEAGGFLGLPARSDTEDNHHNC